MAHANSNGAAQTVTTQDFNERVKRLLDGKPEPQKAERPQAQRQSFARRKPKD